MHGKTLLLVLHGIGLSILIERSEWFAVEFLLTLERNETEPVSSPHRRQTPSNADTSVQSTDGTSMSLGDSPDGASVSDRPTTREDAGEEGEEGAEEDDPLNGQTSNELLSYFKCKIFVFIISCLS